MEEFETVTEAEGFSWRRKRLADDADKETRKRIQGHNRQAKKRARDRHVQPPGEKAVRGRQPPGEKAVGGRGRRTDTGRAIQFEERPTPSRGEHRYMHELSPADAQSPSARTRLQTRRRVRVFEARKKARRDEWRALDEKCSSNNMKSLPAAVQQEHEAMDYFLAIVPRDPEEDDDRSTLSDDSALMAAWAKMKLAQTETTQLTTAIEKRSRFRQRVFALVSEAQKRARPVVRQMQVGGKLSRTQAERFVEHHKALNTLEREPLPMIAAEGDAYYGICHETASALFEAFGELFQYDFFQRLFTKHVCDIHRGAGLRNTENRLSAFVKALPMLTLQEFLSKETLFVWAGGDGTPVAHACVQRLRDIEAEILSELRLVPVRRSKQPISLGSVGGRELVCSVVKTHAVPWAASDEIFLLHKAGSPPPALEMWQAHADSSAFLASLTGGDPGTIRVEWGEVACYEERHAAIDWARESTGVFMVPVAKFPATDHVFLGLHGDPFFAPDFIECGGDDSDGNDDSDQGFPVTLRDLELRFSTMFSFQDGTPETSAVLAPDGR